jgi:hypothetical protein
MIDRVIQCSARNTFLAFALVAGADLENIVLPLPKPHRRAR